MFRVRFRGSLVPHYRKDFGLQPRSSLTRRLVNCDLRTLHPFAIHALKTVIYGGSQTSNSFASSSWSLQRRSDGKLLRRVVTSGSSISILQADPSSKQTKPQSERLSGETELHTSWLHLGRSINPGFWIEPTKTTLSCRRSLWDPYIRHAIVARDLQTGYQDSVVKSRHQSTIDSVDDAHSWLQLPELLVSCEYMLPVTHCHVAEIRVSSNADLWPSKELGGTEYPHCKTAPEVQAT